MTGLATLARPSSRLLSFVALVLGTVIVAIALRDGMEIAVRARDALRLGVYAAGAGGLIAAVGGALGARAAFFGPSRDG